MIDIDVVGIMFALVAFVVVGIISLGLFGDDDE